MRPNYNIVGLPYFLTFHLLISCDIRISRAIEEYTLREVWIRCRGIPGPGEAATQLWQALELDGPAPKIN